MTVNVVKIGGNIIDDSVRLEKFLTLFSQLDGKKILIHGGGKIATKVAAQLGVETQMVEGRRVTDVGMRDVVTMVYGGLINKQIVAKLQGLNCNAIGLTGADAGVILAKKRAVKTIDYGYVGDIEKVASDFISLLLKNHISPIFAPLTFDKQGNILNTNADTQASAIATAVSSFAKVNLIYCFEKEGVLDKNDKVIPQIKPELYEQLKSTKVIFDGMIPKLDNAFEAVKSGVQKVIICHADGLMEALNQKTGTCIEL